MTAGAGNRTHLNHLLGWQERSSLWQLLKGHSPIAKPAEIQFKELRSGILRNGFGRDNEVKAIEANLCAIVFLPKIVLYFSFPFFSYELSESFLFVWVTECFTHKLYLGESSSIFGFWMCNLWICMDQVLMGSEDWYWRNDTGQLTDGNS